MSVWTNLEPRRRFFVVVATIGVFAAVMVLARSAGQKDMALLFGGLEPATAGEVINALEQRGVLYDVRGNAIYVENAQRDSLRMTLAGEGLPATGAQGYELLDGLSGFGTTSQMFDAAYWRAREGELARSIVASPNIRTARVHISIPANRPFQTVQQPTAAVTITAAGAALSAQQIKALQYLVGSAVSGLKPEDVAVIDDDGGLISEAANTPSTAQSDERADILKNRAERLLAARVGAGNAVVEVSLDTVMQSESITERTVDPDSRIAISTEVTESSETSQDSRGGDVTVASNLPDGDAGAARTSANENSETRALTNYEVSQTERQIVKAAGDVRRITVAVLINEVVSTDEDGNVTSTPRSDEELRSLEALVASAVGIDTGRGDEITLRSMAFEPLPIPADAGTEASSALPPLDIMQLIQVGALSLVALILGLFVVRPILANANGATAALPPPEDDGLPVDGFPQVAMGEMSDFAMGDGPALELPAPDAVSRLRDMISERESETVQILQDWIEEPERQEAS